MYPFYLLGCSQLSLTSHSMKMCFTLQCILSFDSILQVNSSLHIKNTLCKNLNISKYANKEIGIKFPVNTKN